jgi:hypothetical protein
VPRSPLDLPLELQASIRCGGWVYAALCLEGVKRADLFYLVEEPLVLRRVSLAHAWTRTADQHIGGVAQGGVTGHKLTRPVPSSYTPLIDTCDEHKSTMAFTALSPIPGTAASYEAASTALRSSLTGTNRGSLRSGLPCHERYDDKCRLRI